MALVGTGSATAVAATATALSAGRAQWDATLTFVRRCSGEVLMSVVLLSWQVHHTHHTTTIQLYNQIANHTRHHTSLPLTPFVVTSFHRKQCKIAAHGPVPSGTQRARMVLLDMPRGTYYPVEGGKVQHRLYQ